MERLYFVKLDNDKGMLNENIKYYFIKTNAAEMDSSEFEKRITDREYILDNHILYHEIGKLGDKLYKEYKIFKKQFRKTFFGRDVTILQYGNKKDLLEKL